MKLLLGNAMDAKREQSEVPALAYENMAHSGLKLQEAKPQETWHLPEGCM